MLTLREQIHVARLNDPRHPESAEMEVIIDAIEQLTYKVSQLEAAHFPIPRKEPQ